MPFDPKTHKFINVNVILSATGNSFARSIGDIREAIRNLQDEDVSGSRMHRGVTTYVFPLILNEQATSSTPQILYYGLNVARNNDGPGAYLYGLSIYGSNYLDNNGNVNGAANALWNIPSNGRVNYLDDSLSSVNPFVGYNAVVGPSGLGSSNSDTARMCAERLALIIAESIRQEGVAQVVNNALSNPFPASINYNTASDPFSPTVRLVDTIHRWGPNSEAQVNFIQDLPTTSLYSTNPAAWAVAVLNIAALLSIQNGVSKSFSLQKRAFEQPNDYQLLLSRALDVVPLYSTDISIPSNWCSATSGNKLILKDFNGDGASDLFCFIKSTGTHRVLISKQSNFEAIDAEQGQIGAGICNNGAIRWGDFNGDGKADLLCSYNNGDKYVSFYKSIVTLGSTVNLGNLCVNSIVNWIDYNGDQKDDLICSSTSNGVVRTGDEFVYLSNGNNMLNNNITTFPKLLTGQCIGGLVTWADFNGDGKVDMLCSYTASYGSSGDVYALISDGVTLKGLPKLLSGKCLYTVGANYPGQATWADFNGDGKVDYLCWLYNSANSKGNGNIYVWLSDGATLTAVAAGAALSSSYCVGSYAGLVSWADFNGDGKADLLCSYTAAPGNNGDVYVSLSMGSALNIVTKLLSGKCLYTVAPNYPGQVTWADFNGDGKVDYLCWLYNNAAAQGNGNVYAWTSDGNTLAALASGVALWNGYCISKGLVSWADFNGDGKADMLCSYTASYGSSGDVYAALSNGTALNGIPKLLTGQCLYTVGANYPGQATWADFNGDGKIDYLCWLYNSAYSQGNGYTYAWLSDGSTLNGVGGGALLTNICMGTTPGLVAWGDFNGDRRADFLCTYPQAGKGDAFVWATNYNEVSDTYKLLPTNQLKAGWCTGSGYQSSIGRWKIDFDGDGKLDLSCHNLQTGSHWISLSSTGKTYSLHWCNNAAELQWIDFNGDGMSDLACRQTTSAINPTVRVLLSDGQQLLQYVSPNDDIVKSDWCANNMQARWIDFNGDGLSDLSCYNNNLGQHWILVSNGTALNSPIANDASGYMVTGFCYTNSGNSVQTAYDDINYDYKDDLMCYTGSSPTLEVH